ncbi:MAG: hypothetical protein K6B74_10180 [Ruminococcus sp.]|nr:hypothetical protein [Ruminococcus sp.]
MLREKIFKNKRTRIGRALPAVIAAVVAAAGLGSCAALEMLDSLAAEEESTAQTAPAQTAPAAPQAPPTDNDTAQAENPPASEEPAEQLSAAAEGLGEPSGIMTVPDNNTNNNDQSANANVELNTDSTEPPQPANSSLLTALTDGGNTPDSAADPGTPGDLLTEAGTTYFTPANMENQSQSADPSAPDGSAVYRAYSELVGNYAALAAVDQAYKPEYCHYYITDIDDNGTPELLIEMGTIETDRTINVFTFNGMGIEQLGNFVAWHTTLGNGNGVLYTETSAMGSYMLSTIRIQDGKLFTESEEQPFSESQIGMPLIGYGLNDRSALNGLR